MTNEAGQARKRRRRSPCRRKIAPARRLERHADVSARRGLVDLFPHSGKNSTHTPPDFVGGLLVPGTRVEDERIGPMADQIKEKAKETGQVLQGGETR
jgi:hypothetical protein